MGKNLKGKSIGRGICQRSDGLYQAKVYLDENPKPTYLYDSSLTNLRLKKKRLESMKNLSITQVQMTLDDWFNQWMETVCAPKFKNTTIRNYYDNYHRVAGIIGHMKLMDLSQICIQNTMNELSKTYKKSTVESSLRTLCSCLEYAVNSYVIPRNPCRGIALAKKGNFSPTRPDEDKDYITKDELDLFFDVAKNSRSSSYFFILLHTGLRVGELCALQWQDIDFQKRELHVYKTINRTACYFDERGGKLENPEMRIQITTPKKEASNRVVPLTGDVLSAFQEIKQQQEADKDKNWGKNNPFLEKYPDLVLTTTKGNCFLPSYIEKECRRLVAILNKRLHSDHKPVRIHPHMFRHTFITNCYQQGLDSRILSDIVGHRRQQMTDHYTHPEDDFMHQEFQKYEEKRYA